MDGLSSKSNDEKNINRSDLSTMYSIDGIPLAQLRPEKIDDATIQKQILLIREICGDINLDIIAIVFHECDYNIQNTIARIKAGDFEDGGWQTAKSNNKKKNNNNNNNPVDQTLNGGMQSDSEHSPSQYTSPTPSLRGSGRQRHRQDQYHYPSSARTNHGRRRNEPGRNQFIQSNLHYSSRNYSNNNKLLSNQQNSIEINQLSKTKENITPQPSPSIDDDVFILGTTQTLTLNNNSMIKSSSTKRPTPSSIPQEPVLMHPIIQCSTKPIDIQFGDVQWNDSVPIAVSPSNSSLMAESFDDQKSSSITNINDDEQQTNVENNISSIYINYQTTNESDTDLLETTNRLSSSSISSLQITDNTIANNSNVETSHLSDHLTDSLQQQAPLQTTTSSSSLNDTTDLPLTATSNTLEYISSTSHDNNNNNSFIPNTFQQPLSNISNSSGGSSSAFTPYNTPGTYSSIPREYTQAPSTWNQQSPNYKHTSKGTILQPGNYTQHSSYQVQPQQQYFVGTYPYPSSTIYPLITQVDSWSTAGFEPYSTYPTSNYIPTYTTQQPYHSATVQSNKYDRSSYDKDFFAHYGQSRLSNSELLNASQTTKDTPTTSKLSANAASFSQGASLTVPNPAPAYYFNPVLYTVPTYYTSHHDRTMGYPSVDNRDIRNGASYAGNNNNNRNHYHHHHQQQQQRTHNNSTWHSQQ